MEQIVPEVFTLPLEHKFMDEVRTIYPVAVETEKGLILVDIGLPNQVEALESQLEDAGFQLTDVETIIITHQDANHVGGLSEVTMRTDAAVAAHIDDAPYIEGDRHPIKSDERYPPQGVDIEVVNGVRFRTEAGKMRVVATPGHTPGHVSLYLPDEKLLLAADALTAEETFGGPDEEFTPDMEAATDSIGRLVTLDVTRTLCYHGGLVEHDSNRIKTIYKSIKE